MLDTIDSLAFKQLDERLVNYLSDKVKINGTTSLHLTHFEIAEELNSSRVVISRLLKQLESQGNLILHRNKIEMLVF
jgi:CRP/FNR family transcriptional regulator